MAHTPRNFKTQLMFRKGIVFTTTQVEHATKIADYVMSVQHVGQPTLQATALDTNNKMKKASTFMAPSRNMSPVRADRLNFHLEGYDQARRSYLINGFKEGFYLGSRGPLVPSDP